MKLGVLFSGGKDSCLALHLAKKQGHDIEVLMNMVPENFDSFMFHKPYLDLLERQADELGTEIILQATKGEKEKELSDLKDLIGSVKDRVEGILVGGIASSYQGLRVKKICDELHLEFVAPLWDFSPEELWKEILENNLEVVMTKIACDGLDKGWLGKVIDKENFGDLKKLSEKYKFRMDFEGGEAETAVLFMPEFSQRIKIDFDVSSEGEFRHWMENVKVK